MGDLTMAIAQYTEAIRLHPEDPSIYYERARLYDQRGDSRLALEDLAITIKLMPTATDALLRHGLYFFNSMCVLLVHLYSKSRDFDYTIYEYELLFRATSTCQCQNLKT